MSRFFCCVAFALVLRPFFQPAEAISSLPRNRVILAYKQASDHCKGITPNSHSATKEAAYWACNEAFKALDAINANSCHNWKLPDCRLLEGEDHRQCSCVDSWINDSQIRIYETKTFRECALTIWTEELEHGVVQTSAKFREAWKTVDKTLAASRTLPPLFIFKGSSSRAGPFFGAALPRKVGYTDARKNRNEEPTDYYCHLCRQYYATTSNIGKHFRLHHPGKEPAQPVPKFTFSDEENKKEATDYYCHFCKDYFSSQGNLKRHFKRRHAGIEVPVQLNSKKTASASEKNQVISEHYCHLCDRYYSTRGNLGKHFTKEHPGKERAPSNRLGKAGTDPKDFICDQCGKAYKWERSLIEHRKSHEEDFECHACGLELGTRGSLGRHIAQKHPGPPTGSSSQSGPSVGSKRKRAIDFSCYFCGENCGSKWNLGRHIEKRHQEHEDEDESGEEIP